MVVFDFQRRWVLDELQREMDRYLQHMAHKKPHAAIFSPRTWQPAVDVYETPEAVVALVDLSGVAEEDIDLVVARNSLTVQGERADLGERTERRYSCLEIPFGPFERTVQLNAAVDPDRTTASYRTGLLEITMPKLVPAGPRQIAVTEA